MPDKVVKMADIKSTEGRCFTRLFIVVKSSPDYRIFLFGFGRQLVFVFASLSGCNLWHLLPPSLDYIYEKSRT